MFLWSSLLRILIFFSKKSTTRKFVFYFAVFIYYWKWVKKVINHGNICDVWSEILCKIKVNFFISGKKFELKICVYLSWQVLSHKFLFSQKRRAHRNIFSKVVGKKTCQILTWNFQLHPYFISHPKAFLRQFMFFK